MGRPHIATVLLRKGYVESVADAFDRYLAAGRPAYRERPRLGAAEAVRFVHESGGVAVVAHPHTVAVLRTGSLSTGRDRRSSRGPASACRRSLRRPSEGPGRR